MAVAQEFGLRTGPAIFVGFLIATSSTAIVLRGFEARGEVDAPHGRVVLGILVFQDLCVVPMMLAIPLLGGRASSGWAIAGATLRAVLVVAGVLVAAHFLVPRAMRVVARTRQRDLFVLSVFLVCLGTAWAVSTAGVSLALGAFLAGLVVAGSDFRHQALSDLLPLREVLSSLFFVSVGMLLDLHLLRVEVGPVAALFAAILVGKFFVVLLVATLMRLPLRVGVLAGAALAQVGEFSFVLTRAAHGTGLLTERLGANLTAATILSMLATPFVLGLGPKLAAGVGRIRALTRLLDVATPDEPSPEAEALRDHVIVAGYGIAGRALTEALRSCGLTYVIVDLNAEAMRAARRAGEPAYFADVTSPEVLEHLGAARAAELVVVINDAAASERAAKAAREVAPSLHVAVRTRYVADVAGLVAAGAGDVVVGEVETAAEMVRRVLRRAQVPAADVEAHAAEVRSRQLLLG
jgi:monovalent cation:H+ antiporter-2, CPA2 family